MIKKQILQRNIFLDMFMSNDITGDINNLRQYENKHKDLNNQFPILNSQFSLFLYNF
jgi:hypothetical protein